VPKPLGGALGVLPVALARHLTEVPGANWILLAAFALAVAAAAYMVTTSIQDRRRRAAAAAATSRTPPTDR
jgi:putative exporter of polyketide antibiotics